MLAPRPSKMEISGSFFARIPIADAMRASPARHHRAAQNRIREVKSAACESRAENADCFIEMLSKAFVSMGK
jgi:hypothetical protein